MIKDNIREYLNNEWIRINNEAIKNKESQKALFDLITLYKGFSDEEITTANEVIFEWVLSEDVAKRYDGLALINEFLLVDAISVLNDLSNKLREENEPSSKYEITKITRIMKKLNGKIYFNR